MIRVLKSGFYTTIQDLGRQGYQHYGVPLSGVMDKRSALLANQLLGNDNDSAVLEITMIGPELKFLKATSICISGADLSPKCNGISVQMNRPLRIEVDDTLSFGKPNYGVRTYLAVKGGIQSNPVLGSRSFYNNITDQDRIYKGDEIQIEAFDALTHRKFSSIRATQAHMKSTTLNVYRGPEFDELTIEQKEKLFNNKFSISNNNNRMAYQLNEMLSNELNQLITSLVMPGTIQLTPSGQMIVLMRDCQTTGGYPRILQLNDSAIDCLAQKRVGDEINFRLIND